MAVQNREVMMRKAWLLVAMLALIYLLVMHLVIANMGGSGSELPTSLWVWFCMLLLLGCGWPCFVRTAISVAPGTRRIVVGALLMSLPLAWSPEPGWRLDALPRFAGLWAGVLLLLLLTHVRFSARQRQTLLYLLVIAGLIQAIYSLLGLHLPTVLPGFEQQVLTAAPGNISVFQQRNVAGSFLACGGAVGLFSLGSPFFRSRSPRREAARIAAICVAVMVLYWALTEIPSRIGWLSAVCVYVGMVYLHWQTWRRGLLLGAPAVGVAIGASLMPLSFSEALAQHDGSTLQRLMILRETLRMIAQHPFLGWGYGSYVWHFSHFIADRATPIANGCSIIPHPHNELLYWWVEGGLTALMGLVLFVWAGIEIFFRTTNRQTLSLLFCLLPLLLHTQVEYPFYQSATHWLTFIVLLSLAAGEGPPVRRFSGRWLPYFSTLLMIVVCAAAFMLLATLRQQSVLTHFEQMPEKYYRQVLALRESGLETVRFRKDRALALIVEYQQAGNRQALLLYISQATRCLNLWVDADMYDNVINVYYFMNNADAGNAFKSEAKRIFTDDNRFQ
ncbi:Wzy polymerase domain-containing protein [Kluyvera sichuanensis]|uniref:PglL family O-oligosaccharyltransferase n=1 Tax=Kluyvera sichuanensis TaxID=2725494 RepID=UPI0039F568EC